MLVEPNQKYIKNGTTYYHGMFGGGVNHVPSFPFLNISSIKK